MSSISSDPLNTDTASPGDHNEYYSPDKSYVDHTENLSDSVNEKENTAPVQYVGSGEDDAPRSPVRKVHNRHGSPRTNGIKEGEIDQGVIFEQFTDKDGEHLTSVTSDIGFKDKPRQVTKEMSKTKADGGPGLVSGRRAGAAWEQSGYVILHGQFPLC